jgi:hypothetical protein
LLSALLPIQPGKRADDAAAGADYAWTERWHRHTATKAVHIDHRLVVAEVADDSQRAHALRPHIRQRYRRAA